MKKIILLIILLIPNIAYTGGFLIGSGGGNNYTFTQIGSCSGYTAASGTTLDCSTTLDIQSGDSLVVFTSWYGSDTSVSVAETDSDNPASMESVISYGNTRGSIGVVTSATTGSGVTFRSTIGDAGTYRTIYVYQFRKTGGTVSKETYAYGTGSDTSPVTSTFSSPQGAVIVAAEFDGNLKTISSPLIGGSSPDGNIIDTSTTFAGIWYSIESSAQSSITAAATLSETGSWVLPVIVLSAQ